MEYFLPVVMPTLMYACICNFMKISSETPTKRTYLSPQRAVLLNIIESNQWRRPVHFSIACNLYFMGGLDEYVQDYARGLEAAYQ